MTGATERRPDVGIPVILELAVGPDTEPAGPHSISLSEAYAVAAAAQRLGVTALRLLDRSSAGHTLDPTVVAAHLAGRHGDIGYLVDVPTTGQAPFNLARRVLSTDRATGGRIGLALRPGDGDEVSQATAPDPSATGTAQRWAEYARVLNGLWESFPRRALLGDQDRALVVDDSLIRPIAHAGRFYRVAGPLDGPSSPQGRPVLATTDLESLGADTVAPWVDAVLIEQPDAAGVDAVLTGALARAGRVRSEVALLGRATLDESPAEATDLLRWVADTRIDGLVLASSSDANGIIAVLHTLVPALTPRRGATLRAGLGLRESAEAAA